MVEVEVLDWEAELWLDKLYTANMMYSVSSCVISGPQKNEVRVLPVFKEIFDVIKIFW